MNKNLNKVEKSKSFLRLFKVKWWSDIRKKISLRPFPSEAIDRIYCLFCPNVEEEKKYDTDWAVLTYRLFLASVPFSPFTTLISLNGSWKQSRKNVRFTSVHFYEWKIVITLEICIERRKEKLLKKKGVLVRSRYKLFYWRVLLIIF